MRVVSAVAADDILKLMFCFIISERMFFFNIEKINYALYTI